MELLSADDLVLLADSMEGLIKSEEVGRGFGGQRT